MKATAAAGLADAEPPSPTTGPEPADGVGAGLQEVRGPSAFGGGRRRFLELLLLMAMTDFKKTFFGTVLGYAWSLLRPLLTFAVLLVVFTRIIRIGSQIPSYPMFLLFNIVFFGFFQEATMTATTAVVGRESIVRKTQFPRLVIPLAAVLTALLNLGMNLIAVVVFFLFFGVGPMWTWLLFPVLLGLMLVLACAVATLLSALYVRRRDVAIIWGVLSMALFYGSMVLIPISFVPEGLLRDLMFINPLVPIMVQAHQWIIDPGALGAVEAAGGWLGLLPAAIVFVGVCAWSTHFFNREAPRVAEEL
ncbi:MAG: ABC transporter permease [Thermoleophilia bacterium]|nr:ABC transporter permease [Thermoleophilia bacterium]